MTVTYLGVTYDLKAGLNQIGDIWLDEGDHELIFRGNGTVSVDYRGRACKCTQSLVMMSHCWMHELKI